MSEKNNMAEVYIAEMQIIYLEQEVEQYDNRTILQMDQYKSREEDQRFYESSDTGTDARTSTGQSAGQTGRQI